MGGRICDTRIVVDVLATRDGWMREEEKNAEIFLPGAIAILELQFKKKQRQ